MKFVIFIIPFFLLINNIKCSEALPIDYSKYNIITIYNITGTKNLDLCTTEPFTMNFKPEGYTSEDIKIFLIGLINRKKLFKAVLDNKDYEIIKIENINKSEEEEIIKFFDNNDDIFCDKSLDSCEKKIMLSKYEDYEPTLDNFNLMFSSDENVNEILDPNQDTNKLNIVLQELNSKVMDTNHTFNDLLNLLKEFKSKGGIKFDPRSEFKIYIKYIDKISKEIKLYEIKGEKLKKTMSSYMRPILIQLPKYYNNVNNQITSEDDLKVFDIPKEFVSPFNLLDDKDNKEKRTSTSNKKCCCI